MIERRARRRMGASMLGVTALAMLCALGCASERGADLVVRGGRILTLDERQPEVEAVAVRDGRIVALGSAESIEPLIGRDTEVIELDHQLAMPGFIESHGHFISLGESKRRLDAARAANWDELVEMVAEAVKQARPGEWITGRGWHQEKWDRPLARSVEGFPIHDALSAVSPDNPVYLRHASGHASLANAKAMALAGVTRATPDPDGGEILKDRNGEPIGIFRETASGLIQAAYDRDRAGRTPEEVEADVRVALELAARECVMKGITTFHDAGSPFDQLDVMEHVVEEGKMPLRLWVMMRDDIRTLAENVARYRVIGKGDDHLTIRAIKMQIDGALGSRGAWLLEPYRDAPNSTGLNTTSLDEIEEAARLAIENDLQLCVHAIGDRGNRETLDIYEAAFAAHPEKHDLRWRIEHAQHLSPADIPRFGELGVIAAMQGIHCTSDAPWVEARLGHRRAEEGAYVWQKLMRSGAVISNGTDTPVEDVDPIACYAASVTRRTRDGDVFFPDQRMSRMEALRSYTVNGAYAGFEEDVKGALEVGKLGDITVLSQDITSVPDEEIRDTEVVYTIVGGKVVYRRDVMAAR